MLVRGISTACIKSKYFGFTDSSFPAIPRAIDAFTLNILFILPKAGFRWDRESYSSYVMFAGVRRQPGDWNFLQVFARRAARSFSCGLFRTCFCGDWEIFMLQASRAAGEKFYLRPARFIIFPLNCARWESSSHKFTYQCIAAWTFSWFLFASSRWAILIDGGTCFTQTVLIKSRCDCWTGEALFYLSIFDTLGSLVILQHNLLKT